MLRILIVAATIVAFCQGAEEVKPRIIGGYASAVGQFPFQIGLIVNGRIACGGTLISQDTIITAAHCVYGFDPNAMQVVAGTKDWRYGGVELPVQMYRVHENYSPIHPPPYDIAIIWVQGTFEFSNDIAAASLPQDNEQLYSNAQVTVSGWGTTYHKGPLQTQLQYVTIPIWGRDVCESYAPDIPITAMCAGDQHGQHNSCPGDSGGPLTVGNKLVGVVSYGPGCGAFGLPVMYTYVAGLRSWIRSYTGI